jgi:Protein of unknown function (DUF1552)
MTRTIFAKSVARRSVLAGVGAGVIGSLLRPLQAQEAMGPPTRLLIVHRPCGTVLENFFPAAGSATDFVLAPITKAFEPLKSEMVIVDGITCPRDTGWSGDQHAAALITMMTGKKFTNIPGTNAAGDPNTKYIVAADKSIDQYLLGKLPAKLLPNAALPSIQSTAYLPSNTGLPSFKVMSYKGNNLALFPEVDAATLFKTIFIGDNAGLTPAQIAQKLDQEKSVLDRVNADLTRLKGLIPASQMPKLDAHISAIQGLEQALAASGATPTGKTCMPPTQAALPAAKAGQTQDEAQHLALAQNQLGIIQTAFQCDLTRVATFSFAHGNSDLRFQQIDQQVSSAGGHHNLSHDTSAGAAQERIDQIYCEQLSAFLQKMKTVQDGTGNLLDNTLVVFFNECAIGNTHSINRMPVLMLGGKSLKLQTGQHMDFGGRFMNDIWAAICGAFGTDASFGDAAFTKGPVSGLFG